MSLKIDAHQHFWKYDSAQYPWMDPENMAVLRRDHFPAELAVEQARVGFEGSIAVQARQVFEESKWLLELANLNPRIKGVVGWVDLCSDACVAQLAQLASHPKFVGVRHVLQDEPDEFMLREDFQSGIARLAKHRLTYDILIHQHQLKTAIQFVQKFPEQPFVLDHLAKPLIAKGEIDPWEGQLRRLAEFPNVMCKLSGMVTEADWSNWKAEDLRPFLDVAVDAFGEDRVMIGSDWPVCKLAASYSDVIKVFEDYFRKFSAKARAKIFGGNVAKFYGIR